MLPTNDSVARHLAPGILVGDGHFNGYTGREILKYARPGPGTRLEIHIMD